MKKLNVKDRLVQFANRYKLRHADSGNELGTFDFAEAAGTVTEEGTEINKELFDTIDDNFDELDKGLQKEITDRETAVMTEKTRATTAEGELDKKIAAETNARTKAVNDEAERAKGVEGQLHNDIETKVNLSGGELANTIVTFSDYTANDNNIASGEKASTLFGKIKKWFGRLKALAFKSKVGASDLDSDLQSAMTNANNAVLYTTQTLTNEQKGRARKNLGLGFLSTITKTESGNGVTVAIDADETTLTVRGITATASILGVTRLRTAADCATYAYEDGGATPNAVKQAITTDTTDLDDIFNATTTHRGTMSKEDKIKLNALNSSTVLYVSQTLTDAQKTQVRTNLGLGSLATKSTIASGDITDGTIVNADINASAAIAQSKIANLTTDLAAKVSKSGDTMTGSLTVKAKITTDSLTFSGTNTLTADGIFTRTNAGDLSWSEASRNQLINKGALAWWTGAFNGVQSNLKYCANGEIASVTQVNAKYTKPSGGIPASDLAGDIPYSKLIGTPTIPAAVRLRSNTNSYLTGDITLSAGTNITLAQSGNTITINSTASGGVSTNDVVVKDTVIGIAPSIASKISDDLRSVYIGSTGNAEQAVSIGIGVRCERWGVAIGYDAQAMDSNCVAIGSGTNAYSNATVLGTDSSAQDFSIAIGMATHADGINNIIIGNNSSMGDNSIMNDSIIIGHDNSCGHNSYIFGNNLSDLVGDDTVILGDAETSLFICHAPLTIPSDERIKENIELANLEMCYNDVLRLPVHRFQFKNEFDPYVIDKHQTGFLAQEVEKVFPKAVHISNRKKLELDENNKPIYEEVTDEKGKTHKEMKGETVKGIKYIDKEFAVPTLWAAFQHMARKIEALEARLAALE